MKAFLKSIDERVWNSVEYGWEKSTTPVSEWQTSQKEAAIFNSKVMNAIFNAVSMEKFKRISNVEVCRHPILQLTFNQPVDLQICDTKQILMF